MRARTLLPVLLLTLTACDSKPIFRASPRAVPGGELVREGPAPGRPAEAPQKPSGDIWTRDLPGDDATFEVAPEDVALVFDAARDALRDRGFSLARIDAANGVITTWARQSAGLATPAIDDESTLAEEFEGVLNAQRRRVRVSFEPLEEGAARPDDYRAPNAPLIARVRVVVERLNTQGRVASSVSIRRSSYFEDATRDGPADIATPLRRDGALAGRIAQDIQRLSQPGQSGYENVGETPEVGAASLR
ncbi:MAG: hypothetical protein AB7G17_08415 [Phycisphaerales bacterium]